MITVIFKKWKCYPFFGKYGNKRIAIRLFAVGTHEPIATSSVNLVDKPLKTNHVFIKEWSENEGMTQALIDAGVVEFTGQNVPVGGFDAHAKLCRLIVDPEKENQKALIFKHKI